MDPFSQQYDTTETPATKPYEFTPDDNTDLPIVPKAIFVGTGGNVRLQGVDSDTPVTYFNLPDAYELNVRASRVFATGTSAANLVAQI